MQFSGHYRDVSLWRSLLVFNDQFHLKNVESKQFFERILNAGKKDKEIKHCNLFIHFSVFLDCKNEISQTQDTHDIAWPYCAILIVLISLKELIFNMHSKVVQEVLKFKGNSGLHVVLYSMRQTVGKCYALLSLVRCLTCATHVVISIALVINLCAVW